MNLKTVIWFVIISVGLLLGMTMLLSLGSKPKEATATSPRAVTTETSRDVGTMKVADEKAVDFKIKNGGKEPLKLSRMNSSCNCTFGQLIYQDKTSQEFGMHAPSGYLAEIAPGDEAVIRVVYRPAIMPVYGPVERQVFVDTNDPANPKLTFNMRAKIE